MATMMKRILEPRNKNRFLVEIYPNGAIDVPPVITDLVASVSGGGINVDVIEKRYLNHKKEFASMVNYEDLTIVFRPDESPTFDNFIREYMKLLKDPITGDMSPQANLDVDILVILLDREGTEIAMWHYQNCWLKTWDGINMDYSDTTSAAECTTTWSVELLRKL